MIDDEFSALRAAAPPEFRPGPGVESRARAALLDRIHAAGGAHAGTGLSAQRVPRRGRWTLRLGLTAAAAVAVVAVGIAVENLNTVDGTGSRGPVVAGLPFAHPANAAEALENAAVNATRRPPVTARPDQWVYHERRQINLPGNARTALPPFTYTTYRSWLRLDGKQTAELVDGRLVVHDQTLPPGAVGDDLLDYATVSSLTTWQTALDWASRPRTDLPDQAMHTFSRLNALLRTYVLPPAVEAAAYRAISRIEGVQITPGQVDLNGRPAIALGLVYGGVRNEILLDPDSYRYLGERAIGVEDHTVSGLDGDQRFRVGDVLNQEVMVVAAIVDEPGDTA
jgi:hypothetical protein